MGALGRERWQGRTQDPWNQAKHKLAACLLTVQLIFKGFEQKLGGVTGWFYKYLKEKLKSPFSLLQAH